MPQGQVQWVLTLVAVSAGMDTVLVMRGLVSAASSVVVLLFTGRI